MTPIFKEAFSVDARFYEKIKLTLISYSISFYCETIRKNRIRFVLNDVDENQVKLICEFIRDLTGNKEFNFEFAILTGFVKKAAR